MISIFKNLMIFFTISLFYGCSGHILQDLIDDDSIEKPSNPTAREHPVERRTPPSQNSVLQSISPSATASDEHEEHRYMQQHTNEWIEKEWNPLTESHTSDVENSNSTNNNKHKMTVSDSNQTQIDEEESYFTLQHYVDKAEVYHENKEKRDANKTKKPSHVDKVNAMPGIGTKATR